MSHVTAMCIAEPCNEKDKMDYLDIIYFYTSYGIRDTQLFHKKINISYMTRRRQILTSQSPYRLCVKRFRFMVLSFIVYAFENPANDFMRLRFTCLLYNVHAVFFHEMLK